MNSLIRPLLVIFASLTVVTGLAYPAAMTAVGQVAFSDASNGSILTDEHGKPAGSRLIGQQFDAPKYIWGRLSATSPMPYNGQGSSGSNLGPTNPALADAVKARIAALQAAGTDTREPVPVDLVTASASGLDPEISPAAALYQAARVANARKIPRATVEALIDRYTSGRQFGILGEPRVNVLQLNLALDAAQPQT